MVFMNISVFFFIKSCPMIEALLFKRKDLLQGEIKMKVLATMVLALSTTIAAAQTYKVDTNATTVKWVAEKEIGSGHAGEVKTKSGSLTFTGDLITAGEVVSDLNTITVTDIPADKEENGKLVGHLKSPDFFNVAKNPEAKLVIKSSEKTKTGLKVKGDLTFNGKTNPIEFDAVVTKTDKDVTAKSDVVLDRTKWDLKYSSKNFFKDLAGDRIIKNDFKLSVNIKATK